MKVLKQQIIGLLALVFAMSFTVNSQEIGDVYEGGIVFYIDETGNNGLIASSVDFWGSYEWGCFEIDVSGADGVSIGTGFQNTLDIINNACSTEIGDLNAAQLTFGYESGGYTDWYLPSKDELIEMYNTIGNGGNQGNLGEFNTTPGYWYWSSTENNNNLSFGMSFNDGYSNNAPKSNFYLVRAIRSVTFETETSYEINDPCTSLSDYNSILLNLNPIQSRDFVEGWNMFGYPCKESRSISETFADIVSDVYIVKNNEGYFFWPEFDFDGIGELIPLEGYQTNLYNPISDFSFCDYSIDFPLVNIEGCTDCDACNFNPLAMEDSGMCIYPELGYDCEGNFDVQIGDETFGGIVFYVDEIEERGLVAAMEDLPDMYTWGCMGSIINGSDGLSIGFGLQNTLDAINGCSEVNTAPYVAYHTSIQDYDDWFLPSYDELIEMHYSIGNGSDYGNIGGFNASWYYSSTELLQDETNVYANDFTNYYSNSGGVHKGNLCSVRPIRAFGNWTMGCMNETACNYNSEANMADYSCEYAEEGFNCDGVPCSDAISVGGGSWQSEVSWSITDCDGNMIAEGGAPYEDCIDVPENAIVSMSDAYGDGWNGNTLTIGDDVFELSSGSSGQALIGTCDGNEPLQIGDYHEGGIVFYIDESGEHGLVAAMEDIEGTYEWGCYGMNISGAEGISIGTGLQNTLDIVAGCSETPIAASEAMAYESEGYSDWYLPSKDELSEMYNTIGSGGLQGNIGGFETANWPSNYWSSSEGIQDYIYYAWYVNFISGSPNNPNYKDYSYRVRVIRAF